MGLRAYIFKMPSTSDCSLGGISAFFTDVCIVNVEGPSTPSPTCPAVELCTREVAGSIHFYAKPHAIGTHRGMFGGTYVATSDSRFGEAVERLGGVSGVAIQLHDRVEST